MKGILFKPDMIQAIIEGRKTQTRRLGGLKETNKDPNNWQLEWFNPNTGVASFCRGDIVGGVIEITDLKVKSRYQVGETVYIKEAYCIVCNKSSDAKDACWKVEENTEGKVVEINCNWANWQSPLFMPEWAARYFILIKDVRAERLQEITEEDANKEGFYIILGNMDRPSARWYFKNAWNSINKDYPWETNPWCFRYEFELKEKEKI